MNDQEKALAALLHDADSGDCVNPGAVDERDLCALRAARLYARGVRVAPSPTDIQKPSVAPSPTEPMGAAAMAEALASIVADGFDSCAACGVGRRVCIGAASSLGPCCEKCPHGAAALAASGDTPRELEWVPDGWALTLIYHPAPENRWIASAWNFHGGVAKGNVVAFGRTEAEAVAALQAALASESPKEPA